MSRYKEEIVNHTRIAPSSIDFDMAATTRGRIPGGYSHAVNKSGLTVAI